MERPRWAGLVGVAVAAAVLSQRSSWVILDSVLLLPFYWPGLRYRLQSSWLAANTAAEQSAVTVFGCMPVRCRVLK